MFRKSLIAAVLAFGAWVSPASAETLTIIDTFGGSQTIWTLEVETDCKTCTVQLSVEFKDPDGDAVNAFTGTYLDAVQWKISNPNIDPETVALTATTAGGTGDWEFVIDQNLNQDQCNDASSSSDSVCGEWISGGAGGGFGPIVNGATYTWTMETEFAKKLPEELIEGNIRAAFNEVVISCYWEGKGKDKKEICAEEIKNYRIFSPGGGLFDDGDDDNTTDGGDDGGVAPEPASLALWGFGLAFVALRLKRRSTTT